MNKQKTIKQLEAVSNSIDEEKYNKQNEAQSKRSSSHKGKATILSLEKRDGVNSETSIPVKKPSKKTLTPFEKLKKRIIKEFPKKKLIGDIIINEAEYKLLIDYFITKYDSLKDSYTHTINDPIFATALVHIGIKYYDGNFWAHVAEVVGTKKINTNYQGWIGESFVNTLSSNNKVILDKNEKVTNILMHGFVSDFYANEMFDFLFKYYNIDLERDLQRNDATMMKDFIEIIKRNDNTGRTYLLVKQTANAICANERGGKIRIRRMLRLIDKCFWEQIIPVNPVSRLSVLFNIWQANSSEFKEQYNRYNGGFTINKGKKNYSSPYIKCNIENTKFKLILPTQLIKFEFAKDVKWNIYNQGQSTIRNVSLYKGVTGYKTEADEIDIKAGDIFNEFIFELSHKGNRLRAFKIKGDCIRFCDKDGDYLNSDNSLPSGDVYAFTKENETPRSEALIENEPIGRLVRSFFEFEYGDIVRLPDGKTISIGKKLEEGLLPRKVLKATHAAINDLHIPIYSAPPTVLLKIAAKRANGTVVEINNKRYRLFDKETTVVELGDRSGETGYIINLNDYGCTENGIYTILIDVPNDRTDRYWKFALINGISYQFEDAPYIFKSKGTIRFNEELVVYSTCYQINKNTDENSFNFEIKPDMDYLSFEYKTKNYVIDMSFNIPVLQWRYDKGQWDVEKPSDIWHSNFPAMIYLKYPEEKIKFSMDEQIGNENVFEDQMVTYTKSRAKGVFECDTTRFKSWFGREKIIRKIFIDFSKNRTEFVSVITQSVVVSHILKGNFESGKLIGELDIVGNSNYYVDVMLLETKNMLIEKLPLVNGKFEIESTLSSGLYKVNVFEDEEDDTGFGVSNYLPIGEFKHNIINPYNLEGKSIEIKYAKKGEETFSQMQLSCKHVISNLKLVDNSDKHKYQGKLLIEVTNNRYLTYDVNVEFYDLNKLQYIYLTYFDGYDYIEFMYDTSRKVFVKVEEKGLKRAVRYRRYESLYPGEYIHVVAFTEKPVNIAQSLLINEIKVVTANSQSKQEVSWKEKDRRYMMIEEMNLAARTYNCLSRAKLRTVNDILECGVQGLYKVRNLCKTNVEEIVSKMHELGFRLEDAKASKTNNINKIIVNQNINDNLKEKQVENKELSYVEKLEKNDILETSLSEIGISMFVCNCLKKANVLTLGDVVQRGRKKIIGVYGLNKNMLKELTDRLYAIGITIE
jgi:hypothetical protein